VRIGLASDSFGNLDALERAIDTFGRQRADRVFFLGGRCADVDRVLARRRSGSREVPVPGTDLEFLSAVRGALERQAGVGNDPGPRIVKIASRACPEYESGTPPRKQVDMVDGHICCLVHDKAELSREDIANATVLFHGNSVQAALVQIGPRYFVTPGHLRAPAPEGRPATFALLDVQPAALELVVFSDAGTELRRERAPFGSRSKVTLR
jgi:predicted phosphodiesterase